MPSVVVTDVTHDPNRDVRVVLDRAIAGTAAEQLDELTYSIATASVSMSEAVAIRFVGVDPVAFWVRPDGMIGIALA